VTGEGTIVKLENGSLWQVDAVDTVKTALWLPTTEIAVCGPKMINVDDGESAVVSPLRDSAASTRASPATGREYTIQASANDETFVVNGAVFKAKTYCFNFKKDDRVVFISGSANGACSSAELLNVRTGRTCRVWCE
jgi:hypothetical protein